MVVTKWLRRNREINISSPLWRNAARLRKYLAPRSLSLVSCPALPCPFDHASNFCNRLVCSNFFTVRKRKVGPKIRLLTHIHTHISRLRNRPLGAPLTFHRLDPRREIRSINSNYISVDRAPFSCSYFSFSSSTGTTPTEYGDWYMSVYPRDWRLLGWFSGCQRNPIPRSARASRNEAALEFECPEEFGYYPHPRDCTQYYVCVFGGALLESCTGGLMYRWV